MKDTIKVNNKLDEFGTLTETMPENAPRYNYKAINTYCKANNKTLAELTEKEIEQFKI